MNKNSLKFTIDAKDGKARKGEIKTAHGNIKTPAFMPVGTLATVKAMKNDDIKESGADIILGNVYHLMLRPGEDLIEKMGGLHKFMNWNKPILTDSGGFQVMSLGGMKSRDEQRTIFNSSLQKPTEKPKNEFEDKSCSDKSRIQQNILTLGNSESVKTKKGKSLCKITDEGAEFSSHLDGSKHFLTPERSIQIQHKLDANITMIFDQCVEYPATYEKTDEALTRSISWAKRSKDSFVERDGYGIFGIQQGGTYQDLREKSSKALTNIGFDGYAIGGLAVGEGQEVMFEVLDYAPDFLPEDKPRYLMGVGKPSDIVGAVLRGVDMFDCVMPTRSGRTGQAFVVPEIEGGVINIKNAKYKIDEKPLDENCECYACKNHSRSYLHHLFKGQEILASMLLSEHNIFYYQKLMQEIRDSIKKGNYKDFVKRFGF